MVWNNSLDILEPSLGIFLSQTGGLICSPGIKLELIEVSVCSDVSSQIQSQLPLASWNVSCPRHFPKS